MTAKPPVKPLRRWLQSVLTPPASDGHTGMAYWRSLILFYVLMGLSFLGMTAYLPSVVLAVREGLWGIVLVDTAVFAAVIYLFFSRRLSFSAKSTCLLLVFFGLGAWLLAELGPFSAGSLWLFTFSVMTGVLLGLKPAAIATLVNAVTIGALGYLMANGRLEWETRLLHPVALWFVIGANFIFLNTIAAISIAVLGRGLEQTLAKERKALAELEAERRQLIAINQRLETEMAERRRAQAEKERLEKQLQVAQKMEAMGTLAGGIAHDFNNILAAILGYVELSLVDLKPGDEIYENLESLRAAAERARDLVRQILTFSRRGEKALTPFRLADVAKEAVRHFAAGAPPSIQTIQRLDAVGAILGDPSQIHQVVLNLCANGAHAMGEAGGRLEVELKAASKEVGGGETTELPPGDYLCLSIRDSGHGIPDDIMERIFDPFFTTKPAGKGTGMGLAVVHGIVQSHGGAMTVESQTGRGSTFTVWLPVLEGDPGDLEERRDPLPTGTEAVLFVDDEVTVEEVASRMLERLGYAVTTRSNGADALELFNRRPDAFDLVITDMTMPKMTGEALAHEILSRRPDMPIIITTGFSERLNEAAIRKIGIRRMIMKPLNFKDFARAVREVLDA